MYAIVLTGGKQYKVSEGDSFSTEKLDAAIGDEVALPVALLVDDKGKVEADPAKLKNAKVYAEVEDQYKGEKQIVFKFKKRKNYRRTKGHRQQLTKLEVVEITADGKRSATKKATPKPTAAAKKPAAKTQTSPDKKTAEKKPATKTSASTTSKSTSKAATTKKTADKAATSPAKKAAEKKDGDK
jgi:large subunit ribosomal protein L21